MAYLKIDPEFASKEFSPKLTENEFNQLEANLLKEGCRDPLRAWREILIDGHNRYQICIKHNISFGITQIDLPNREAAKLWILENHIGRRNLTDDQRAVIAGRIAKVKAAENKKAAAELARIAKAEGKRPDSGVLTASETRVGNKATKEAAKQAKVAERKVRAAQKLEKTAPEVAQKVLNGEKTLRQAVKEAQPQSKRSQDDDPEAVRYGICPEDRIFRKACRSLKLNIDALEKRLGMLGKPHKVIAGAQGFKNTEDLKEAIRQLERVKRAVDRSIPWMKQVLDKSFDLTAAESRAIRRAAVGGIQ